jgi:hypothetical protein
MSNEDLMKPRYKVIADYPGNIMPVGSIFWDDIESVEIITPTGSRSVQGSYPYRDKHKYPHLFKPLQWWEERKPEEMPEYVKITERPMLTKEFVEIGAVVKILKHFSTSDNQFNSRGCQVFGDDYMSYSKCVPATEAEYNAYLKTLTS